MKKRKTPKEIAAKYANGGTTPAVGLLQQAPGVLDALISLVEGGPEYTDQPIYNATTMRNMVSPYAMGGTHYYAKGGVHNKARLIAAARAAGLSPEEYSRRINKAPDETGIIKKKRNLNKKALKFKYALGGKADSTIEVEDEEVLQTPDGSVYEAEGATHEQGGIDIQVPDGTKIYSDRVSIDGITMSDRKKKREKRLSKLTKLLEKRPGDKILQETFNRTSKHIQDEEAKDMAIQEVLNSSTNMDSFAFGGMFPGNPGDPIPLYDQEGRLIYPGAVTNNRGTSSTPPVILPNVLSKDYTPPTAVDRSTSTNNNTPQYTMPGVDMPDTDTGVSAETDNGLGYNFTLGDYVGLGGTLFNAIAPLINTRNNARAQQPNINRFKSFGKDALDANQTAQSVLATTKASALSDIDTSANTAYNRNRNSAQGLSTMRALDILTDMTRNKARQAANNSYSTGMVGLLGEQAQLENLQDQMSMSGQTRVDAENKADIDNYYSAMAENLVNFGSNIQNIGRNLNVSRRNAVDANLISQLSKYGLTFDEDGNLVNAKQ